jgi:DNA-binding MarR family transcriptional regulator
VNASTGGTSAKRSPTADGLAVWREFVETGDYLRSILASRLQAESDLSTGDYAVLLALSEAQGKRVRSSELAEQVNWERSRLSHHLARMEGRGLVRREKCADDSRGSEVILTDEGATRFRRSSAPHLRAIQQLFLDAFDADTLRKVDEITTALRAHLGTIDRDYLLTPLNAGSVTR